MAPGTLIGGKYRLTRRIGAGAMGVVWAAMNEVIAREVAVKLILQPSEDLRRRLLREARACGQLKHKNVIEMYDVGETTEGDPFLVMPLLTGETLADLLGRQRRLDPTYATQIARDVALALGAAHAAGIIHRDLKPANIFLHEDVDPDGTPTKVVKVLDFGVSKNLAPEAADSLVTATGGMIGSPAYMSPEQAKSQRTLDGRSDLWSLGVILFEMLTGKRPFQGDTNQALTKILLDPIPLISQFERRADPRLVELVSRCIERDLARRVGSALDLAAMLKPFTGQPVQQQAPKQPAPAASSLPRLVATVDDDDAVTECLPPKTLAGLMQAFPSGGAGHRLDPSRAVHPTSPGELSTAYAQTEPIDIAAIEAARTALPTVAQPWGIGSGERLAGAPFPDGRRSDASQLAVPVNGDSGPGGTVKIVVDHVPQPPISHYPGVEPSGRWQPSSNPSTTLQGHPPVVAVFAGLAPASPPTDDGVDSSAATLTSGSSKRAVRIAILVGAGFAGIVLSALGAYCALAPSPTPTQLQSDASDAAVELPTEPDATGPPPAASTGPSAPAPMESAPPTPNTAKVPLPSGTVPRRQAPVSAPRPRGPTTTTAPPVKARPKGWSGGIGNPGF